ncbi:MAG: hypothetical protein RLZZ611_321 [Cyanobacteriota bacterium]|jgi:hypothetical protein
MTVIPHVLRNAAGEAVSLLLLEQGSDWQPPAGHTVEPDPDGAIWAAAATPQPEPVPPADWDTFKRLTLADPGVNAALATAAPSAPAAVLALPAALMAAASGGGADDFRAAWLLLRRLDLVPQATLDQLTALAHSCNLPAEFVRVLGGQQ